MRIEALRLCVMNVFRFLSAASVCPFILRILNPKNRKLDRCIAARFSPYIDRTS
jgi:hypothetical protein